MTRKNTKVRRSSLATAVAMIESDLESSTRHWTECQSIAKEKLALFREGGALSSQREVERAQIEFDLATLKLERLARGERVSLFAKEA